MDADQLIMIGRIVLAALLGLFIGLERERHGRAAGLRTCMLVAMAGALIMSLSLHLSQLFAPAGVNSMVRMDPGRLASYAIAGMGFLGAGAIIQGRSSARGVTTGAAMWTCTVLGLAVGAGLYLPAIVTVVLVLFALIFLRRIARRVRQDQYVALEVESIDLAVRDDIRQLCKRYDARIMFAGRERCLETKIVKLSFSLAIESGNKWNEFLEELESLPGITCYRWQEAEVP
jgi:putative Mg2+ transporter-C (MgtC) family protein